MLVSLCFLLCAGAATVSASSAAWPYLLAQKFTEDFQAENHKLEEFAKVFTRSTHEEHYEWKKFEEHSAYALKHADQYDFIIIGGGTSGSVLANRLSEVPEWKILLLEAGAAEETASKVPSNWELLKNTKYNWAYPTTPQNSSCLAFEDHKCTIPSGRVLGGTSSINSMIYTRGNHRDYDIWADEDNIGWCYADVLPIFKKIEDINFHYFDKHFHRRGGFQHLEHPQHLNEHLLHVLKSNDVETIDYNGKHQMGFAVPQLSTKCGRRLSASDAYLEPASKRENLVIKPLSQVTRLIISDHTKEVQAVEYIHGGELVVAKPTKEVILSAGAIQTPKILLLSGIGPKADCDRLSIPLVADLQVGRNMKIRPSFIGLDFILNSTKEEKEEEKKDESYDPNVDYLKNGKGPLTSPGIDTIAYLQTEVSKDATHYPDIELELQQKNYYNFQDYAWTNLAKKYYDSIWEPLEHKKSLKITINLNHPKSKGVLKLHTSNPLDMPLIEPHFLSDEDDVDFRTILAGIYKAIEVGEKLGLHLNEHKVHGCEDHQFGEKLYWKCAIKYLTVATSDVTGTARMGSEHDHEAVVNNHLKVYGVHKLRIADPSIIPISMTGNLMAPSLLIGEKAANLIIEDWKVELE